MSLRQPVQYPVKYYSHLDAGAPQLADIDGNIKTILKAGLVTGIGTKAGAGWTSLFEDDFRIVLRRPLRTGNPPDIKIENGVINGTASHRIVSQDNPTGLNDATELAAVNLMTRDTSIGTEWHLVASDFGFVLCYGIGSGAAVNDRKHIMYVGSLQKISESASDMFVVSSSSKFNKNGAATFPSVYFLDTLSYVKDMRTNITSNSWVFLKINSPEKHFNNDYLAQKTLIAEGFYLPFYLSVTNATDKTTEQISIEGRPMLRYFNKQYSSNAIAVYIPLDYWEL